MVATWPTDPNNPRPRTPRTDGEQSRERLLAAALALFADQGFAKTSTREIAEAAGTNVAAIAYYFGDKAGLYQAVFSEPMGDPAADVARIVDPSNTLDDALRAFLAGFVEPLRQGDMARQCMKLHMREMLEPTGLWQQEIERSIRPSHDALVGVLTKHLALPAPDGEVERLVVSIAGLGVHLHVGRDITDALVPGLNAGDDPWAVWLDRMVMYAGAMVQAERGRRERPEGKNNP